MKSVQVAELVMRIGRAKSYREIWRLVDELFAQAPLPAKALQDITDAVRASQQRLHQRDRIFIERAHAAVLGISKVVRRPPPKVFVDPPTIGEVADGEDVP